MSSPGFLKSQFTKLPYPYKKFTGQTIIITGANVGLGLEAARHLVRLDASKVILAVRTISKGETAKNSIEDSTNHVGAVEVWELDQEEFASVKRFAEKAQGLERLDVVILNAGLMTQNFSMAEGHEKMITVNVISTVLLALLLIPKLRETAVKFGKSPVLTFTGSFTHFMTPFPERNNEHIFEALTQENTARMEDRYKVSKLIQLLCLRELSTKLTESSKAGDIIASTVNPGFVATSIMRHASGGFAFWGTALKYAIARNSEVGSRTLVHAAEGGSETHGKYLNDCKVGQVSDFVMSGEGMKTQKQLWQELSEILEKMQPDLLQNI